MAISYVKVKRTINVGDNPGEKFLAQIVREQPVNLDLIADQISGASTMSKADVMGVLQQLQVQMSYHLLRGATIQLGLLGTFSPSLRARAMSTVDEVTVQSIKGLFINFRSSTWLNKEVKNVGFRLVDPTIKGLQVQTANAESEGVGGEAMQEESEAEPASTESTTSRRKTTAKTQESES